jgi:signal transduction histidine kinase
VVAAASAREFRDDLAVMLGAETAQHEVAQAMGDLGLDADESRPHELRRLRDRLERNLSGLIGPPLAHMVVNRQLQLDERAQTALADSMRFVEERIEASRSRLDGLSMQLDDLRRYHRQILLELPLGVCALGPGHQVVIWNVAMEVASGVTAHDAVGKPLVRLPAPWNEVLSGFARASDDHIHHLEVRFGTRPHWFNLHKAAFLEPGRGTGNAVGVPGIVILLEDLTDLENLGAELAHSDRLASIGRLAAGVAHEIGNPLTGIASLAQNLRHEEDAAVIRQSVEDILGETRRIADIVQALMSFSRGGGAALNKEPLRLDEILNDALKLVRLTHRDKHIAFLCDCADSLRVSGDRRLLSQVFVNLLSNAGDASPRDAQVMVRCTGTPSEVVATILDQGPGIPEEMRERLFEPFATTKPAGQGTGLGLALAYKFVHDHDGSIEVTTPAAGGALVTVTLPAAPLA